MCPVLVVTGWPIIDFMVSVSQLGRAIIPVVLLRVWDVLDALVIVLDLLMVTALVPVLTAVVPVIVVVEVALSGSVLALQLVSSRVLV